MAALGDGESTIENHLGQPWQIAIFLAVFAILLWVADRRPQRETIDQLGMRRAVLVGVSQILALMPGVSRSGATISAGLLQGLDRVSATRLSFFLSIPALLAAGLYELKDALSGDIGIGQTVVGTIVSFVVAYASIAALSRQR